MPQILDEVMSGLHMLPYTLKLLRLAHRLVYREEVAGRVAHITSARRYAIRMLLLPLVILLEMALLQCGLDEVGAGRREDGGDGSASGADQRMPPAFEGIFAHRVLGDEWFDPSELTHLL